MISAIATLRKLFHCAISIAIQGISIATVLTITIKAQNLPLYCNCKRQTTATEFKIVMEIMANSSKTSGAIIASKPNFSDRFQKQILCFQMRKS